MAEAEGRSQTLGPSPPMSSIIHGGDPAVLEVAWLYQRTPPQSLWGDKAFSIPLGMAAGD